MHPSRLRYSARLPCASTSLHTLSVYVIVQLRRGTVAAARCLRGIKSLSPSSPSTRNVYVVMSCHTAFAILVKFPNFTRA